METYISFFITQLRIYTKMGARCSFVVERALMMRWVTGLIPHDGPIELFLVPATTRLRQWYMLSYGVVHIKPHFMHLPFSDTQ